MVVLGPQGEADRKGSGGKLVRREQEGEGRREAAFGQERVLLARAWH